MTTESKAPTKRAEKSAERVDRIAPAWLTGRKQLAAYTGMAPRTISRMMAEGKIPHRRLNAKSVLFRVQDVDRVLAGMGEGG